MVLAREAAPAKAPARPAPAAHVPAAPVPAGPEVLPPVPLVAALQRPVAASAPPPPPPEPLVRVYPQLVVGAHDAPEERDADRAARDFERGAPTAGALTRSGCGCASCCGGVVRRDGDPTPAPALPAARLGALGAGAPLRDADRRAFEPYLQRDLSGVRVHTSAAAADLAGSLAARAFTWRDQIVFGPGRYAPETPAGRRLLAHELAHVAQGGDTVRRDGEPGAELVPAERAPPTVGDTLTFEGRTLSADAAQLRDVLLRVADAGGPSAMRGFVSRFEAWRRDLHVAATPGRHVVDVVDGPGGSTRPVYEETTTVSADTRTRDERAGRILPLLQSARTQLDSDFTRFVQAFEQQARRNLDVILADSQERTTAEIARYGLGRTTEYDVVDGPGRMTRATRTVHHHMADSRGSRGMATAAGTLAGQLGTLASLQDQRRRLERTTHDHRHGEVYEWISDPAEHARLGTEIIERRAAYLRERVRAEADYPILAAYGWDGSGTVEAGLPSRLRVLAAGPSAAAAESLNGEADQRLANIAEVRAGLADGSLTIWQLDPVVQATMAAMSVTAESARGRALREYAADRASARAGSQLGLGLLALVLGLIAAIPTGGSSLVAAGAAVAGLGAAAISTHLFLEHLQEYQLQSAAGRTDFDRARAVSAADPSLFWLALDLVGAVFDLAAAARAFRTLAPLAREAIAARRAAAEGSDAVARLAAAADEVHPGLGARVTETVGQEARHAVTVEESVVRWEAGLNQETRGFLVDNPEVRALYHELDPSVRRALTFCASRCIIPSATREQARRIRALTSQLTNADVELLRPYFHARADGLDAAIAALEGAAGRTELRTRLLTALSGAEQVPTGLSELLTAVGGDAGRLAHLLEKGGDLPRLQRALATVGGDVARLERVLVHVDGAGQLQAMLGRISGGSLDDLEALLVRAGPGGAPPSTVGGSFRVQRAMENLGPGPHTRAALEAEIDALQAIDDKILVGRPATPTPVGATPVGEQRRIIGGHDPALLSDPRVNALSPVTTNADGTISVKFDMELLAADVNTGAAAVRSKPKTSTMAPRDWTARDILVAGDRTAATPAIQTRVHDRATLHVATIDGVEWAVIRDATGRVISSFPTGGAPVPF